MSIVLIWFITVGVAVTAWMLFILGGIMKHVIWAAASSISMMRWRLAMVRNSGGTVVWRRALPALADSFVRFLESDSGSITASSLNGYWNGIGDWKAYSRTDGEGQQP